MVMDDTQLVPFPLRPFLLRRVPGNRPSRLESKRPRVPDSGSGVPPRFKRISSLLSAERLLLPRYVSSSVWKLGGACLKLAVLIEPGLTTSCAAYTFPELSALVKLTLHLSFP